MSRTMTRIVLAAVAAFLLPFAASAQGLKTPAQCGPGGNAACFALPIIAQAGIAGTTTNDAAAAGQIGEILETNVPIGSAVSLTTTVVVNVATRALTAGDWTCWGSVAFSTGGTTTATEFDGAISLTTAAMPTAPGGGAMAKEVGTFVAGNTAQIDPVGTTRISTATGTTAYLVAASTFLVSTNSAYGYIGCRRTR